MTPDQRDQLERLLGATVARTEALGRGTSGSGTVLTRLRLSDGRDLVAKRAEGAFSGLTLEAFMLETLAGHGFPVPRVHHAEERLLVMDFVPAEGRLDGPAQEDAADKIAALHGVTAESFGLDRDTVIGPLPQPNPQMEDWRSFFAEHRLLHMARCALEEGRIAAATLRDVETLCGRLDRLIPDGSVPALIHGDLWGGNVLVDGKGRCGFIDPAIYYADPEIDLAYSTLFGTFGERFFARYQEHRPLAPGFEDRRDLYNLYPLLVHVRLFGGSYAESVRSTLRRFL